jgi:hypothetical protein
MQAWDVHLGARRGIRLEQGVIAVGEQGRGRRRVTVQPPAGSVIEERHGEAVLVECPPPSAVPDAVALVLIRDHSGYRGWWRLTAARPPEEWDAIVARDHAHAPPYGEGDECAPGHADDNCAICGQLPPIPQRTPHTAYVIAEGRCAQGAAGRMGGGPEYLVALRAGEAVEIVRYGRLYGGPQVLRVEAEPDGTVRVTDPHKDAIARHAARHW